MFLAHDLTEDGDGPAVVLLHSSVCDRRMWEPQLPALAGFRVLRPDFRGFGESPAPTEPYNPADDVRELLDHRGIDDILLVGASYGGRIAAEFAARWPDRVRKLALVCAARAGQEPTPSVIAFGDKEDALLEARDIDAAVELNVDTWLGPRASEQTRASVAAMQRRTFEIQLDAPDVPSIPVEHDPSAITAPTLVVSGAHDLDHFHRIADVFADTIPDAHRVHLDWAGHLPSIEDPAAFNPLLLEFLS